MVIVKEREFQLSLRRVLIVVGRVLIVVDQSMVKLGNICPELQRPADELAVDAPVDIRNLSASQLAAELEARGIEPTTDLAKGKRRKYCPRRQVKHWEQRRRNRK